MKKLFILLALLACSFGVNAQTTGPSISLAPTTTAVRDPGTNNWRLITLEKAPGAATVALAGAGAGNTSNGAHKIIVELITAAGHTNGGTQSATVTVTDKTVDGKVAISGIPTGSIFVTSRKVYMNTVAAPTVFHLLSNGTISDNTTTTLTANDSDTTLGSAASMPTSNTTANPVLTYTGSTGAVSIGGVAAGTVTSVTGTANQINVATGTTTPALSLSSTLIAPGTVVATTSITTPQLTLGTVSTTTGGLRLANSGSAFLTTLQAGNAAAARTYTWPTNFGAAGAALTDAAGNGTLSWVVPSAGISGLGTANTLPKFTGATAVGNSRATDSGAGSGFNINSDTGSFTAGNLNSSQASIAILGAVGSEEIDIAAGTGYSISFGANAGNFSLVAPVVNIDSGAGTTTIGDVNSAGNGTTITVTDSSNTISLDENSIFQASTIYPVPTALGGSKLGRDLYPFESLFIGNAANNNIQITGTATGARVATFPDATITVAGSATALTSGRVPFATTGGLLTDSANLTWTSPTLMLAGATTTGPDVEVKITGDSVSRVAVGINTSDTARIGFGPGSGNRDAFIEYVGAGAIKLGGIAVDTAPVAQNLSMQNVLAGGTSDVAGANFTLKMSQGKGTGAGGSFIVQVAPAGSTGTAVNALATALTIDSTKLATFPGGVTLSSSPLTLSGNISGAGLFSTSGIRIKGVAATFTDTSSSGTVATAYNDVLGGNTWAASSATTITNAYAAFFSRPIAGSNVTVTNGWALGTNGPVSISVGATTSAQTDLLVNPTTKASGNYFDVQLNGTSHFNVSSVGSFRTVTQVNGEELAAPSFSINYNAPTVGLNSDEYVAIRRVNDEMNINGYAGWRFYDTQGSATRLLISQLGLVQFGGTTNSFSAIARDAVNGFTLQSAAGTATWNDASTAGSGTVANRYLFGIAAPTLTATNASVTNTVASTFYIGGAPTDSTNTTSTTKWALLVAAGNVSLSGSGPKLSDAAFTTCAGLSTTANVIGCVVSDATLKQDFHNYSDGLEFVRSVNAETYSFKKGSQWYDGGRTRLGLVAQDVAKRLPMAVYPIGPNQPLQIDYNAVISAELDAIKTLDLKIQILNERINTLNKLINH